ncbi:MAG: glycosyltransferase family 1 protein [Chlorobiaceae bacterium]
MKIGIDFTHDLGYSGIGTYCRSLTAAMMQIEPENNYTILTLSSKVSEVQKHFPFQKKITYSGLFPDPMLFDSLLKKKIRKLHQPIWKHLARKYDLVHFTHQEYFISGIPNAAVTIHDIIPLYNKTFTSIDRTKSSVQATAEMIKHACYIFVPSRFVLHELLNYFPECEHKIQVTYEGSKEIFCKKPVDHKIIEKYGLQANSNFFLYVGRYEARKNLDNLILAYSHLPDTLKQEVKLVLICPADKNSTAYLYKKIAELGLQKNTLHLQNVTDEELVHFYNKALALLLVSYSEGFGLPLVEAMNCGCPSIIANCSSLPEISGGSSILVEPASVESIRDGMMKIIDDPELRSTLSEKSLLRAKNFSWRTTALETLKGYHEICS